MAKTTTATKGKDELDQLAEDTSKSQQLTTQGTRDIAAYDEEFEHSGAGMQGLTKDEFRMPTLRVLDPKSPETYPVENGGLMRTDGGKADKGDILLTGLRIVWKGGKAEATDGFYMLPVEREQRYVEWIPKDDQGKGGGFVGVHMPDEPLVVKLVAEQGKFRKQEMENGNQLVQTFTLFCIVCPASVPLKEALSDASLWMEAMIHFSSTQIPKYQQIVNLTRSFLYNGRAPAFWQHVWHMKTQMDPPKGGNSWYGWVPTLTGKDDQGRDDYKRSFLSQFMRNEDGSVMVIDDQKVKNPLYERAVAYYKIISEGQVKSNYAQSTDEAEAPGSARTEANNANAAADRAAGTNDMPM